MLSVALRPTGDTRQVSQPATFAIQALVRLFDNVTSTRKGNVTVSQKRKAKENAKEELGQRGKHSSE